MKRKADAIVRTYQFYPGELAEKLNVEGEVLSVEFDYPSTLGQMAVWTVKTTEVAK